MPCPNRRFWAAPAILFISACASGAGSTSGLVGTAPLPGDNYAYVYRDASTVGRIDTRTGTNVVIAEGVSDVLASAATRTGHRTAVAYTLNGTTRAVAVDAATGSVTEIHNGSAGTRYTMAWSTDGERLGVGFRGAGGGGILVLNPDGSVRDIGCRASNRFEAWRSPGEVVVHDGANFYVVSTANCATLATLPKAGKSEMAYSENGRRVSYFESRNVQFTNRPGSQIIAELSTAGYNGSGATKIADYQSRPSGAVLSPDGGKVAYEVVSARWANTSHVVIYDISSKDYSYVAEEKQLGVPSDFGACWAPDGRRIAHDRIYARSTGEQTYVSRQVVIRDGASEKVVFDEILNLAPSEVSSNRPARCQWIGGRYVLVATRNGDRIIDTSDAESYEVSEELKVLGATVFEGTP